jgi:hypothetical protein
MHLLLRKSVPDGVLPDAAVLQLNSAVLVKLCLFLAVSGSTQHMEYNTVSTAVYSRSSYRCSMCDASFVREQSFMLYRVTGACCN